MTRGITWYQARVTGAAVRETSRVADLCYVKRDSEVTGQAGRVVAGGVRSRAVGEPVGFGGRDGCY